MNAARDLRPGMVAEITVRGIVSDVTHQSDGTVTIGYLVAMTARPQVFSATVTADHPVTVD